MAVKAPRFPGYTPITDRIFIRNEDHSSSAKPAAAAAAGPDDPTTILIFGWGDAQPRHVAKYADGYHALFPGARIVVVVSPTIAAVCQSLAQRTAAMMPVVDAVFPCAAAAAAERDERVVLHAMSGTGGIYAAATLNAYRERHGAGARLPHRLCVSDSAPGSAEFATEAGRWARAMALGTAAWFPWPFAVTRALWWAVLWAAHLLRAALRAEPAGKYSTRAFLDHAMATPRAPRLYMYSKEDDLIGWRDLEHQAAVARGKGYTTILERFEGSPHVGHMRMFPDRYWGAIARCWKQSAAAGEMLNGTS
ncbi:hypothetical protein F4809DRAFT_654078 [Biscogniauxia mediterranea]|nr:hypothetical protein F4809DRAFT_654078 [Biscogniauxia mediterranea]